jgi:hypothetical protein
MSPKGIMLPFDSSIYAVERSAKFQISIWNKSFWDLFADESLV